VALATAVVRVVDLDDVVGVRTLNVTQGQFAAVPASVEHELHLGPS
jgi:hypothetical protein